MENGDDRGQLLREALVARPRVSLAELPTPLQFLPNLSQELGIQVWVKRDDQTGLALGGNKARKLEFLMSEVLAAGADVVLTTGSSQSNHARMTVAACRRLGLDCLLVLTRGRHVHNGNVLLDRLLGAAIEWVEDPRPDAGAVRMDVIASELRAGGRKPYVVPYGGSAASGAAGYVLALQELTAQAEDRGLVFDRLYLATSSGGTQAGMLAGLAALGVETPVVGVSVAAANGALGERVHELSNDTLAYLRLDSYVSREAVDIDHEFVGDGYGLPTPGMWEALRLLASREGLLLDPVYSGKAMAGLLAHARAGLIPAGAAVLFLHTGGLPALFAYGDELLDVDLIPGLEVNGRVAMEQQA